MSLSGGADNRNTDLHFDGLYIAAFLLVGSTFVCTGLFPECKELTAIANKPCDLESGTATTDKNSGV